MHFGNVPGARRKSKKIEPGASPDGFPWREWMKLGLGKMGMRPADFWAQSFNEWTAAAEGFADFHGGEAPPAPPTWERVQEMIAQDEAKNG